MKTLNSNQLKKNFISPKKVTSIILICVIIVILLNILTLANSISPNGLGLSNEMVRYESPSGKYSMLVSTKWVILDFPAENHRNTDVKTSIGSPFSSLEIYVSYKAFNSMLIDDVISWGRKTAETNSTNYREINISEISNEKRKGVLNEYSKGVLSPFVSFYWSSKSMHCFDYYFLENRYGYSFSFCSVETTWDNANGLFKTLINSIDIK